MSRELYDKKLAVLGAGKLGGILVRAYLKQGLFLAKRVTATVKHCESYTRKTAWRRRSHRQSRSG
jgi:pyrroline-5-carboxylate reductase